MSCVSLWDSLRLGVHGVAVHPQHVMSVWMSAVPLSLTAGIVFDVPNIQTFIVNAIKVSHFNVISWYDGIKCVKFHKNITFYGETFTDGAVNLCCEKVTLICFYAYDSSDLLHRADLIQEIPSVVLYIEASYSSVQFKRC